MPGDEQFLGTPTPGNSEPTPVAAPVAPEQPLMQGPVELKTLELPMLDGLLQLISAAETLAIAASSNPEDVMTPAQYQLEQSGFAGMVAYQTHELSKFVDLEALGITYDVNGYIYGDYITGIPADWEDMPEAIVLLAILAEAYDTSDSQSDFSNTMAWDLIAIYQRALAEDAEFPQTVAEMRDVLGQLQPDTGNGKALLSGLQGSIDGMQETLPGMTKSMGEIINAFQAFHDHMAAYYNALDSLEASLDRIDWLLMTPEERRLARQQENMQAILNEDQWLSQNTSVGLCEDLPPEAYHRCVQNRLRDAWEGNSDPAFRLALLDHLKGVPSGTVDADQLELDFSESEDYDGWDEVMFEALLDRSLQLDDPLEYEQMMANAENAAALVFFALGFMPVVGSLIDLASAISAATQGNYGEAALNLGAVFIDVVDLGKLVQIVNRSRGLNRTARRLIAEGGDDVARYAGKPDELDGFLRQIVTTQV